MKIRKVTYNNKKKSFEVYTQKGLYYFPYSKLNNKLKDFDKIKNVFVDKELGCEAFTYVLFSGKENTIHIDQVLEYNKEPEYLRKMLLYKLTIKAQKILESKSISKREVIRRLHTSPTQFYRLINQTVYNKTIDQMINLLTCLDYSVDVVLKKAS